MSYNPKHPKHPLPLWRLSACLRFSAEQGMSWWSYLNRVHADRANTQVDMWKWVDLDVAHREAATLIARLRFIELDGRRVLLLEVAESAGLSFSLVRYRYGRGLRGAALVAPPRELNTHCKYGHELTAENVKINGRGVRICQECQRRRGREAQKRATARLRAAAQAVGVAQSIEDARKFAREHDLPIREVVS